MRKLLVTGSNGFVGSYFINKYKEKYDIKTFSFRKDDFATLDCSDVDVVFHLSALVHQMGGATSSEYERVNVTQTLELAKKAKTSGVKHFIFMSTVKVYGEETDIAYTENSQCNPQDDYGKSKLKAEVELLKLETDNFKVSIIRTPIVYGYGVKANIKSLISLVSKVPVLPFGNIPNKRSMVYVGNLCHLVNEIIRFPVKLGMTDVSSSSGLTSGSSCNEIIRFPVKLGMTDISSSSGLTSGSSCEETPNQVGNNGIYLAADDEPLSTTRLIELIAKSLNKKVYLIKIPFFESLLKFVKPSFHKRLYGSLEVDNALTKEKLNLKNPYSVEEGIELMLNG